MKRDKIISTIQEVLKKHGTQEAYLFGSFARKERMYRDIDIAIRPPKGKFSLLDLVHIENVLNERTGKKVEIITLRSIHPRLRPYITKDMVRVI
jgi:predicted nucleotidyltransferase